MSRDVSKPILIRSSAGSADKAKPKPKFDDVSQSAPPQFPPESVIKSLFYFEPSTSKDPLNSVTAVPRAPKSDLFKGLSKKELGQSARAPKFDLFKDLSKEELDQSGPAPDALTTASTGDPEDIFKFEN